MTSQHPTFVQLSRRALLFLALLLLLPWMVVVWLWQRPSPVPRVPASAPIAIAAPSAENGPASGQAGPWGKLEMSRILIEPPEDFIPAQAVAPVPPRWFFKGYDDTELAALWAKAGLSEAQRTRLVAQTQRDAARDVSVVTPEPEFVLNLSPQSRGVIYAVLAKWRENRPQNDPFRIRADSLDEWFDESLMSPEIIPLVQRLIYHRNNIAFFSDQDLVLPRLAPQQRGRFIKNMSRKSALLVNLVVPHDADVDALARYWGAGRRNKDVKPLLDSLAQRASGGSIDIAHLLPSFARTLLYTYPLPSLRAEDATHDCHWTALNFYSQQPDERFGDIGFVQQTLVNDYYPTGGAPALGDIIVMLEHDGQVVHSCVYIADNIVFTKNGASFSTPWQLARLENVAAFYSLNEPVEIRRYRARGR